jgi:hypothetical protein
MFKLIRPCENCPFRIGQGERFQLGRLRLEEIFNAVSFQCHKTVDYEQFDDPKERQGKHPQQCAGLMSLLHRAGRHNQIMQIAERLGYFDPNKIDHSEVYSTIDDAIKAHKQ